MGLFDTVICEYPLPDGREDNGGHFQTKDMDCYMGAYKITADGRLLEQESRWVDDESLPLGLRREDRGWNEIPFHGFLSFYTSDDGVWREYNAKFTDGRLVEIVVVPPAVRFGDKS